MDLKNSMSAASGSYTTSVTTTTTTTTTVHVIAPTVRIRFNSPVTITYLTRG
ncbi:hypothetical protein EDF60_0577 [Leucobacter luti]|uniref:hypothetical protein n=1 Tax=Leucobacter luti TaxID=340320 RepID=UPI0010D85137|nr:hypothetical protein [Leucobacter luti]MCW2288493.1 hypothetical protein [Leucobacter luti]TCK45351.1 hypothetical protein EDF60_0577 [Leucobacter luti]